MAIDRMKLYQAGTVFTPSSPIDKKDLFSGRSQQIDRVINAIVLSGQRAILYGERGVGKTSLASVIHDFLPQSNGIINVRVNCDQDTDFKTLFKNILEEIKLVSTVQGLGFNAQDKVHIESLGKSIEDDSINPNTLRFIFRQLNNKVIIIIDEFDRVKDEATKRLLQILLKTFLTIKWTLPSYLLVLRILWKT